jgi:ABC-type branched-subunit amino acid transport system ATPase component
LDPIRTRDLLARLHDLRGKQRVTAIIVEQNIPKVMSLAHRVIVMRDGHIGFSGPTATATLSDVDLDVFQ